MFEDIWGTIFGYHWFGCLTSKRVVRLHTIFCWPNLENFPWNCTLSSSLWPFNNSLPTYPPLGQFVKLPNFSNTWPNKDLAPNTNWLSCGRHHGVYLIGKPMTSQPTTLKITYYNIKVVFLAKKWNFVYLLGKKLEAPPQGFSQAQMWIVLEATIDSTTT